jgi:hypothetical protein
MGNLAHNERLKFKATFFNNLGVIALSSGGIFAYLHGNTVEGLHALSLSLFAGLVGGFCYAISQWTLSNLKD